MRKHFRAKILHGLCLIVVATLPLSCGGRKDIYPKIDRLSYAKSYLGVDTTKMKTISKGKGVPSKYEGSVDSAHVYSYRTSVGRYEIGVSESLSIDMEKGTVQSIYQRTWTDHKGVAKKIFERNFPNEKWMGKECKLKRDIVDNWTECTYKKDDVTSKYTLEVEEDLRYKYRSAVYHEIIKENV